MEILGGAGGTCDDSEVLFPVARVVRTELDLWAWKENLACHFLCTYILLWLMTFAWSKVSGNHGGRGLLVGNTFGLCYKTGRTEEQCLCQDYGRMLEFGLRQSNPDIVC